MNIILCTREEADNYLMHYRTKGSINGVRRYQYEDGSLTPEGYIHYGYGGPRKRLSERQEEKATKYLTRAVNWRNTSRTMQDNRNQIAAEGKSGGEADRNSKKIQDYADKQLNKYDRKLQKKFGFNSEEYEDFQENRRNEAATAKSLSQEIQNFEKQSPEKKRSLGDRMLLRLEETKGRHEETTEEAQIRNFITDRIIEKSGNWNSGDMVSKNRKKADADLNDAVGKTYAREMEVRKAINFNWPKARRGGNAGKREAARLRAALANDSTYQALKKASNRVASDYVGVVLKDIGFSDTPQNRAIIWNYVFND